jgi:ribosome biogenesis protein UTP30
MQRQVVKASQSLLKHMASSASTAAATDKKSLLADNEDDIKEKLNETPIWLTLTTKKHIVDAARLKPGKIALPHSLDRDASRTICLITADPQRTYKDLIAHPSFPADLRARITRVVGVKKVKAKYSQYEAQRALLGEHDIFLADDRIVTQLPKLLGKTFYKSSAKRPIPISMQGAAPRAEGKRISKKDREGDDKTRTVIEPAKLAKEISKALDATLVALAPSVTTSVRVALAGWTAKDVAENVERVSNELIDRFVPKKWRGVRSLHIKGPETASLPIWLADELWEDANDVVEEELVGESADKTEANVGKKRKADGEQEAKSGKKSKKDEEKPESNDNKLDKEIALRKEKLKAQKEAAKKEVADIPAVAPKSAEKKNKKRKSIN